MEVRQIHLQVKSTSEQIANWPSNMVSEIGSQVMIEREGGGNWNFLNVYAGCS